MGDTSHLGTEEAQGMLEQISLLEKNAITEVHPKSPGFYSNLLNVYCIPVIHLTLNGDYKLSFE